MATALRLVTTLASDYQMLSPGVTFSVSFLQLSLLPSIAGNVATYSSVNIGDPDPNRVVYCTFSTRAATTTSIASATINSVSATIHAQIARTYVGADNIVGIFSAPVPTGTSVTIAVTLTGVPVSDRCYLGSYGAIQSGRVDDTDVASLGSVSSSGTRTLTPTVPGGAIIAAVTSVEGSAAQLPITWTGPTNNYDEHLASFNSSVASGALMTGLTGSSQGISFTLSATSDLIFAAVAIH